MTVRVDEVVARRFAAWCKLNGLSVQQVIADFMREKGDKLAGLEDKAKK